MNSGGNAAAAKAAANENNRRRKTNEVIAGYRAKELKENAEKNMHNWTSALRGKVNTRFTEAEVEKMKQEAIAHSRELIQRIKSKGSMNAQNTKDAFGAFSILPTEELKEIAKNISQENDGVDYQLAEIAMRFLHEPNAGAAGGGGAAAGGGGTRRRKARKSRKSRKSRSRKSRR